MQLLHAWIDFAPFEIQTPAAAMKIQHTTHVTT